MAEQTWTDQLVPDQVMPEPLVFMFLDEEQESVGNRPRAELLDLLQEGVSLSLIVESQEYCIEAKDGTFVFEVWREAVIHLDSSEAYDSLDALLAVEASRPSFDLRAFTLIG